MNALYESWLKWSAGTPEDDATAYSFIAAREVVRLRAETADQTAALEFMTGYAEYLVAGLARSGMEERAVMMQRSLVNMRTEINVCLRQYGLEP